jgi:hypothetical protein
VRNADGRVVLAAYDQMVGFPRLENPDHVGEGLTAAGAALAVQHAAHDDAPPDVGAGEGHGTPNWWTCVEASGLGP